MIPPSGKHGQAIAVRIVGKGFRPAVQANYDDESRSKISVSFKARLGEHELEQVRFVDSGEVSATVPAGLPVGVHDLIVVDPAGSEGSLAGAFTVLGDGDLGPGDGPRADLADAGPRDGQLDMPDTGGRPDGNPFDVTPWPDSKPWPDITPWPDVTPWPDTQPWPPDGPGYIVNEDFSSGTGSVSTKTGSWSVHSGSNTLRQDSTSGNGYYAVAPVTGSNYTAETRVSIHAVEGLPTITEGAALGVRVQSQTNPSHPPGMYNCFISADNSNFGIGECSGTTTYCTLRSSTPMSFSMGTAYTIRATVNGNSITCELVEQSKSLTIQDGTWASGDVALVTFHAQARFHYLKVW